MKVLHVFNRHRAGGGADNAWDETIRLSRQAGIGVATFERDSRALPEGLGGKVTAFTSGLYPRSTLAEFSDALRREAPDIVHTHELFPLISPWVLKVCATQNVPVVHSCYDFRLTCPIATHVRGGSICTDCIRHGEWAAVRHNCRSNFPESAAYALRNAVARRAGLFHAHVSRFIVLSPFAKTWLINEAGVSEDRISVNPPAVALPDSPADPGQGSYIGFAGRFVPEKGVEILVEAARRLQLPLRLAGNEANHPALMPGDPITCVLTPTRENLVRFYRGARVIVVPSLWFETFALVAAEAMAHGIPVVASRIGALQETVPDGVGGLLFPAGDVAGLARVLEELWNDRALCRRLGSGGRERVASEFSEARHVERLTAVYAGALGEQRRLAA